MGVYDEYFGVREGRVGVLEDVWGDGEDFQGSEWVEGRMVYWKKGEWEILGHTRFLEDRDRD